MSDFIIVWHITSGYNHSAASVYDYTWTLHYKITSVYTCPHLHAITAYITIISNRSSKSPKKYKGTLHEIASIYYHNVYYTYYQCTLLKRIYSVLHETKYFRIALYYFLRMGSLNTMVTWHLRRAELPHRYYFSGRRARIIIWNSPLIIFIVIHSTGCHECYWSRLLYHRTY